MTVASSKKIEFKEPRFAGLFAMRKIQKSFSHWGWGVGAQFPYATAKDDGKLFHINSVLCGELGVERVKFKSFKTTF